MSTCSVAAKIVGLYVHGLSFFGVGGRVAASGLGAAVVVGVGFGAGAVPVVFLGLRLLSLGTR